MERLGLGADHRAADARSTTSPTPRACSGVLGTAAPGRGRRAVPARRRQRPGRAGSVRAELLPGRHRPARRVVLLGRAARPDSRGLHRVPAADARPGRAAGRRPTRPAGSTSWRASSRPVIGIGCGPGTARRPSTRWTGPAWTPCCRPQLWDAWLSGLRRRRRCCEQVVVRQPDFVVTPGRPADRRPAAGLEGLAGLADRPVGRAVRTGRSGGEELRLLRPHAVRGAAAAGALEARRVVRRGRCRRGARPVVRRASTSRRRPSSGWISWSPTCSRPTGGTSAS